MVYYILGIGVESGKIELKKEKYINVKVYREDYPKLLELRARLTRERNQIVYIPDVIHYLLSLVNEHE